MNILCDEATSLLGEPTPESTQHQSKAREAMDYLRLNITLCFALSEIAS